MPYTYEYPRPSVTVDAVVFGYDGTDLKILLIQRKHNPFENYWALPGGFVDMSEDLETAVQRELEEETGLKDIFFEQLFTFGAPNRDPRGRVISIAYFALVKKTDFHYAKAASDAKEVKWFSMNNLPKLAFDHNKILGMALDRIRGKVRWQPIGFELLPQKFPLSELQHIYETILDGKLDKRNFRKNILKMDILKELDEFQKDVSHRAARLYSFDQKKYDQKLKEGFDFELRQKLLNQ
ncbi:MAG: NUDIX domain-containing protein [Chitinophagales bacterium]